MKIIFKENFIYLKNAICKHTYTVYSGTPVASDVDESYLSSHESSRVTSPSSQSHLNFFRVGVES